MIPVLGRGPRTVLEIAYLRGRETLSPRLRFRVLGRGEPSTSLEFPSSMFGLPDTFEDLLARPEPPVFRLPDDTTLGAIRDRLCWQHGQGDPIWVALEAPRDLTTLVPWERLLAPLELGRILRAPHLPLVPVAPSETMRVALCVNLSDDADLLGVLAGLAALRHDLAQEDNRGIGHLSVFLHAGGSTLSPALAVLANIFRADLFDAVDLHTDGAGEDEGDAEERDEASAPVADVRHPWLRWVKSTLNGRRVDGLVMVGDARLFPGRSALALGYRGRDGGSQVGLVRAEEFDRFVTQLGACRVDLLPVRPGWSELALRHYAEQLSWLVPGPVNAVEEAYVSQGVGALLARAFGQEARKGGRAPVFAACHAASPGWPGWRERPRREREILDELTLANDRLRGLLESGRAPGWVAVAQRTLERLAAGLLRDDFTATRDGSEEYAERREGIERGMRDIVEAVEEFLGRPGPEGEGVDEPPRRPAPDVRGDDRGLGPGQFGAAGFA